MGFPDASAFSACSAVKLEDIVISLEKSTVPFLVAILVISWYLYSRGKTTRFHEINTTLFLFYETLSFRKRTCAKKTKITFLVKVFTEGKKLLVTLFFLHC